MDEILSVKAVSKKFCRNLRRSMLYGTLDLAKGCLGIPLQDDRLRPNEFWALKDVSLSLQRGETLGLIGANGSGKSTLLRLITGIYPPDAGEIAVRGKIGALISLGAGFNPHMTGQENIYVNGTILGMSRKEIDRKFDEIVSFAGLGEFLDAPVSSYSSGMTVRLGFSIAAHSDADLLIVDEVLSVGDLAFAIKCHRKMSEFRQNGGSTILVSHSNQLIRNVCKTALWLEHGNVRGYGDVQKVCNDYEYVSTKDFQLGGDAGAACLNYDAKARVTKVEFLDRDDQPTQVFESGDRFKARIHVDCEREVENPIFTFAIHNLEDVVVVANYSNFDGLKFEKIKGKYILDIEIDRLALRPSKYFVSLTFTERDINFHLEWHEKAHSFSVKGGPVSYGIFNPYPTWRLESVR